MKYSIKCYLPNYIHILSVDQFHQNSIWSIFRNLIEVLALMRLTGIISMIIFCRCRIRVSDTLRFMFWYLANVSFISAISVMVLRCWRRSNCQGCLVYWIRCCYRRGSCSIWGRIITKIFKFWNIFYSRIQSIVVIRFVIIVIVRFYYLKI